MKAVAKATSNIAFIKYWGKKDEALRIPANSSISMNLSNAYSITSVELSKNLKKDQVYLNSKKAEEDEYTRIVKHLDLIRALAKSNLFAKVKSRNSFPKGTGIASSASGFAALTLAATKAFKLNLSQKKLSILARLGSGSACRSIPPGFVEWVKGADSKTSYAKTLYPPSYWDILDIVAIVGESKKEISSTKGHSLTGTSPFFNKRIADLPQKIKDIKKALKFKDFTKLGTIIEEEALNMHAVMLTQRPPLIYFNSSSLSIIREIYEMRKKGIEAYFTLDAGPNVHIICKAPDAPKIKKILKNQKIVKKILVNKPGNGTEII